MELGVSNHVWIIRELIDRAMSAPAPGPMAPRPTPTRPKGMSASEAKGGQTAVQPKRLYVIKGGKGRGK